MKTALDRFARSVIVPGVNARVRILVRPSRWRLRELFASLAHVE